MDVLNCELLWIGGSCYRKLTPINRFSPSGSVDVADKCDEHIYDVGASGGKRALPRGDVCMSGLEHTDMHVDLHMLNDDSSAGGPKGFFRLTHYVPQKFIPRLCGKKHVVRIQMEHDTNTSIKVPSPDSCEDVIITGQREQDVESAHLRISATVSGMRQHEHYTHFVCFPLNNQKLGGTLEEFKEIVMKSCTGRGLDASLFVNKQKLHLTIGMLVLLDAKECSMAQKVLEGCKDLVT
ncbi:hypothetical protein HPB49_016504 [Dermacentor silvarum]|uniref:Uncharacterized protein n=1 Tax=Dermacentor silvarum TaxID=543639 RepID=A0ACB8DQ29_DERSI|nr:hypothetical protein HPB49_016504 [Dermacentor silvarum]